MKKTYLVITDNSEETIREELLNIIPVRENETILIFDNHSTDNTVAEIIGTMGILWKWEDNYKFYINHKKKMNKKEIIERVKKIANGSLFLVEKGVKTEC